VIGLVLLFLANGGSRGNNFLTKYFTFSFTVGIKYGSFPSLVDIEVNASKDYHTFILYKMARVSWQNFVLN